MAKTGRPRAIRSKGEMAGVGTAWVSATVRREFKRHVECDARDTRDEAPFGALLVAVSRYSADVDALAAMPSAEDERSDLQSIAEDSRALAEDPSATKIAARLLERLDNFPPVSRGLISTNGAELFAFEALLDELRSVLRATPELQTALGLPALLLPMAQACERRCEPDAHPELPSFTKRPLTARDRLIREMKLIWNTHNEPPQDAEDRKASKRAGEEFVRAMLAALEISEPDRLPRLDSLDVAKLRNAGIEPLDW